MQKIRQSPHSKAALPGARRWLAAAAAALPILAGAAAPAPDDALVAAGKSRFDKLCVTCHGKAGEGREGRAPKLQQRAELAPDFIRRRIVEGKHGDHAMPPWGTVLDAAAVNELAAYVEWLAGHDAGAAGATLTPFPLDDPERIAAGRKRFNKTCAGYCHGYDGVGGRAPDFKGRGDELSAQFLFDTIYNGREGADVMPPWGAALSEERIWELVAFLRYLGTQPAE